MEIVDTGVWEAWRRALKLVWKEGREFKDQENRLCREILNVIVSVENPKEDIAEPLAWLGRQEAWIFPSSSQVTRLMRGEASSLFYHYDYGERVFSFQGKKDQIKDFVVPLLLQSPESRRALISLYDPEQDSQVSNPEIPCLVLVYFRIISGKLHITGYIRSNDMFIGWPANAYQLFVLQKSVADKLGVALGSLTTIAGSAHVFLEYEEDLNRLLDDKS